MKNFNEYIDNISTTNKIFEYLSDKDKGNNVLIDETDNYNLYIGKHVLGDRNNRHVIDENDPSLKIYVKDIINVVREGYKTIEMLHTSGKIEENNPASAAILTYKKKHPYLNVICFIKQLEKDTGKFNIIVKTVMLKNDYKPLSERDKQRFIEQLNINIENVIIDD